MMQGPSQECRPVIGPSLAPGGVFFRVWAPRAGSVAVVPIKDNMRPEKLIAERGGYFSGLVPDMGAGDLYVYLLDGALQCPDPASRLQPEGVHGPSQVVDPCVHDWQDCDWRGINLADFIIYELHVGTFSPSGTFAGVEGRIDYLCELGITALEIMPVAQFPGGRNWGYDGVFPYAVQASYGGPTGLKSLVDACHRRGLAVILDVVYNHLGPEGNYLHAFAPYFTDSYQTPWGQAVNFDGPGSDGVREYFIGNALSWIEEYHVDALRLDAVHGIFDHSARHILNEIVDAVHLLGKKLGRKVYLMAESNQNDSQLIRPGSSGGYGLDSLWNDDFHHALHTVLTGERQGYYQDFGEFGQLVTAVSHGFVYAGEYSPYRQRRHGNDASDIAPVRFVVCSQNHDQVGNRKQGDRLTSQLNLEQLKLAAGVVLLSPFLPLLFMGEEYGERAPFQYFVSHGDQELIEAVRCGRREEFAAFDWQGEVPDPQDVSSFRRSCIDLGLSGQGHHVLLYRFYRKLIMLRKMHPSLAVVSRRACHASQPGEDPVLMVVRESGESKSCCLFSFSPVPLVVDLPVAGDWQFLLDSSGSEWGGPGSLLHVGIRKPTGAFCHLNAFSMAVLLAGETGDGT